MLKGVEIQLSDDIRFNEKYGDARSEACIRWWPDDAETLKQTVTGPLVLYAEATGHDAERGRLIGYDRQTIGCVLQSLLTDRRADIASVERGLSGLQRCAWRSLGDISQGRRSLSQSVTTFLLTAKDRRWWNDQWCSEDDA